MTETTSRNIRIDAALSDYALITQGLRGHCERGKRFELLQCERPQMQGRYKVKSRELAFPRSSARAQRVEHAF